jgi:vacuolar-type H+-ATPase subunit H
LQAEQMVAMAREEAAQLIEQTAIMQQARDEAKQILAQARQEAAEQRQEIEEYIDSRLATLEVILNKTQEAISRGRERLAGSTDNDVLSQLSDK